MQPSSNDHWKESKQNLRLFRLESIVHIVIFWRCCPLPSFLLPLFIVPSLHPRHQVGVLCDSVRTGTPAASAPAVLLPRFRVWCAGVFQTPEKMKEALNGRTEQARLLPSCKKFARHFLHYNILVMILQNVLITWVGRKAEKTTHLPLVW